MKIKIALGLILGLFSFIGIQAQIQINEISASNNLYVILGWDDFPDWVELKNTGSEDVNLNGYYLSDNISDPWKWSFPEDYILGSDELIVVLLNKNGVYFNMEEDYFVTNFKLSQTTGEEVVLSDPAGVLIESFDFDDYGPNSIGNSWSKNPGTDTWAISTYPTPTGENIEYAYNDYAQRPIFDMDAGYYASSVEVNITSPDGFIIKYTIDGSTPNETSEDYTGPITINETTVIKAIAVSAELEVLNSIPETNTYFIGDDNHTVQMISISGPSLGDGQWIGQEYTHLEMFDENGVFITEALGESNEHGADSNAFGQRGFDFVTRDQYGYNSALEAQIFDSSERDSFQRLIFKAGGDDNVSFASNGAHLKDQFVNKVALACDMELDTRNGEFAIVYINGEYWGIYDMKEKIDDEDYLNYRYNQKKGDIEFWKVWGGAWIEIGYEDTWSDLSDFIVSNDMSDASNYDYININIQSQIDYFIINSYFVNSQWLNWDHAWWKGTNPEGTHTKWGYTLWDTEMILGQGINYTGIPDQSSDADPMFFLGLGDLGGQGHVPMFNSLMDNDEFSDTFFNSYEDYLDGCLTCESTIGILDSLVAVLQPEMERQFERWGGDLESWLGNIASMEIFLNEQCSDVININEEEFQLEKLTVGPNPNQGKFEIYFPNSADWVLYDSNGRTIDSGYDNHGIVSKDYSHLADGLYLLKTPMYSTKIIIE